jgi:hypothetical protein
MFYLYQHIRLDKNQVFYIGISRHNKRYKYKRAAQRDKRSSIWKNIVSKTDFKYEILLESEDVNLIKSKEIELIAFYGKIKYGTGCLANITDGGEGTFGYIPDYHVRLKQSLRMKGKKHTEETKEKMRVAQVGKFVPEEVGKKISSSKKGKNLGKKHNNVPLKVLHIPSNTVYKSITQAAKHFGFRRGTLAKRISSGEELEFQLLNVKN